MRVGEVCLRNIEIFLHWKNNSGIVKERRELSLLGILATRDLRSWKAIVLAPSPDNNKIDRLQINADVATLETAVYLRQN